MSADDFRAEMMTRVRAFDKWAFSDQLANPAEYQNYTFDDWLTLFNDFMENYK